MLTCRCRQGELQGARSNLQTILRIVSPIAWGRMFSWGLERGRPGLFYLVAAALYVLQLACANAVKVLEFEGAEGR